MFNLVWVMSLCVLLQDAKSPAGPQPDVPQPKDHRFGWQAEGEGAGLDGGEGWPEHTAARVAEGHEVRAGGEALLIIPAS